MYYLMTDALSNNWSSTENMKYVNQFVDLCQDTQPAEDAMSFVCSMGQDEL